MQHDCAESVQPVARQCPVCVQVHVSTGTCSVAESCKPPVIVIWVRPHIFSNLVRALFFFSWVTVEVGAQEVAYGKTKKLRAP